MPEERSAGLEPLRQPRVKVPNELIAAATLFVPLVHFVNRSHGRAGRSADERTFSAPREGTDARAGGS